MPQKRLTAIRTEVTEQLIIRFSSGDGGRTVNYCPDCDSETDWISFADARAANGCGSVSICELIDRDEIHSSLTAEGHLLVCAASLGTKILKGEQNNET